jgi:hypothetical protein
LAYEAGKQVRIETGDFVAGTGPVEGVMFELADVGSHFQTEIGRTNADSATATRYAKTWSKRLIIRNREIRASTFA